VLKGQTIQKEIFNNDYTFENAAFTTL